MHHPQDPTSNVHEPAGLLDAEDNHDHQVVLRAGERDDAPIPPGTFTRIGGAIVTTALLIAATYVVPAHLIPPAPAPEDVEATEAEGEDVNTELVDELPGAQDMLPTEDGMSADGAEPPVNSTGLARVVEGFDDHCGWPLTAANLSRCLQWSRPWTLEDPVPFWNFVDRAILERWPHLRGRLGLPEQEHDDPEAASERLAAAQEMAKALAAQEAAEQEAIADKEIVILEDEPSADDGDAPKSAYKPHEDDAEPVPQSLELPAPDALDRFFDGLARSDAGFEGAITRVVHWGDSAIANDNISSTLRFKMQRRFGDAGHGFHLIAKPTHSYRHRGIIYSGGDDWQRCYIINKCKRDGLYGIGGTTVWSAGGAWSRFKTATETGNGRKASRFELWYLAQPGGGKVQVRIDGQEPVVVETAAEALEDRWQTFEVPDGPHTFDVRAIGGGVARLYGVVLERDVPGVVWDNMSQLGAFTGRFLFFDDEHIKRQIEHRGAQLLVFTFGGNDLLLKPGQMKKFKQEFTTVLTSFRAQEDPPACLVMAPVDHGVREGQRIVSHPMQRRITEAQRSVALEQGCAFFDTQAAMGGDGAVARWRTSKPPLISGDLAHLTDEGQRAIGHMVYLALMEAYRAYHERIAEQ